MYVDGQDAFGVHNETLENLQSVGDGSASGTGHSARSALFEPVAHPVLRSFDPKKLSSFLKKYEMYKLKESGMGCLP